MSENTEISTVENNTFDYLAQPAAEVETKPEATPETASADPGTEGGEEEQEHKPWQAKKNETPTWARKRFKEYSSTVRELKEHNQQLMETVKQVLAQVKPGSAQLKKEDFIDAKGNVDETAWVEHLAEQRTRQSLEQYDQARQQQEVQRQEQAQLQQIEAQHVQATLKDIPDYLEAIQNGDPDVRLPTPVLRHLAISPAGTYVKYRIATDDELSESLKQATPEQKVQIISALHDEVLDTLIKRQQATEQPPSQQVQAPARTPSVQPKRPAPPKAPPTVRGKGHVDLLSLSGDDYVRARNEARRTRG